MKPDWKDAKKELPANDASTNSNLLMCNLYVHSGVEPEVEYYYEKGYFLDGKFYKEDGEEYKPDYWKSDKTTD